MKIYVFLSDVAKKNNPSATQVIETLKHSGAELFSDQDGFNQYGLKKAHASDYQTFDYILSLGGDGTIIRAAHLFMEYAVPILGINLGHLGFMADIPTVDIELSLRDFFDKKFKIEERIVMECHINDHIFYSINDVTFHRAHNPSLIDLSVHLNDVYVNSFKADGLIIATPNGSTAYSLASGGPIMTPGLDAVALTPISPHTISNRAIIMPSEERIHVKLEEKNIHIHAIIDGVNTQTMNHTTSVILKKSSKRFRLISLDKNDYFKTLRTKLGWSGKLNIED